MEENQRKEKKKWRVCHYFMATLHLECYPFDNTTNVREVGYINLLSIVIGTHYIFFLHFSIIKGM